MFRMLGTKVELYRYKIIHTENDQEMVENCISEEHKNEIEQILTNKGIEFTTIPVNQENNEWFNGLKFNSYDEALEIFNKGQTAYNENIILANAINNLQLRADMDYIAIITGVTL